MDPMPSQVKANANNDLLFRTSAMTEEEKKKQEKMMQESALQNFGTQSGQLEYFTD